ncbi:STAS-like domain-containing protein [Paraburkholderia sediminicola]|uniref:STAS-like domain-containing protein n=1 Tax=Paraburkholderia sediminicola TaxID=458836 RepID=UPI0038B717D8
MMSQIVLAKQFSRYPAGRYLGDGPFSGELFRNRFLSPALRQKEHISIDLDGARGYGSSFLEEAFGGLVREGYSAQEIRDHVDLISSDISLLAEIWEYISDAEEVRRSNAQ